MNDRADGSGLGGDDPGGAGELQRPPLRPLGEKRAQALGGRLAQGGGGVAQAPGT